MFTVNTVSKGFAKKNRKKICRWNAWSGGTYGGRGMNWQNSRSGGWVRIGFEWGQSPLFVRMPKLRGFTAYNPVKYSIVSLSDLEEIAKSGVTEITKEILIEKGIIRKNTVLIKILGGWEVASKVTVYADKASSSAINAIEKAGWTIVIPKKDKLKWKPIKE